MVATVAYPFEVFMAPHVRALSQTYEVTIVSSDRPSLAAVSAAGKILCRQVTIARNVSPFEDLRALWSMWKMFRRERFDVVQSMTPKAGLLAMVAARLAGVPARVHWFTGQVWATKRGMVRRILKRLDQVTATCSTHLLADSPSQRDFLVTEGVARAGQVSVLCRGSVCGVDTNRFRPDPEARVRLRQQLGLPPDAVVVLFAGRLNFEKGLRELAAAFSVASETCDALHMVILGTDEAGIQPVIERDLRDRIFRVRFVRFTTEPEAYMAAADILVLASRREGFGTAVIEAASCEVPAIATDIYGLSDAVDAETGILVPVGDRDALAAALTRLALDHGLRQQMGRAGRRRVQEHFSQRSLVAELLAFYRSILPSQKEAHR